MANNQNASKGSWERVPLPPTVLVHFCCILPEPERADVCQDVFTPSLEACVPVGLASAPWTMLDPWTMLGEDQLAHEALPGPSVAVMAVLLFISQTLEERSVLFHKLGTEEAGV